MSSMTIEASGRGFRGTTAASDPARGWMAGRAFRRAITPAGLAAGVVCSALAAGAVTAAGRAPVAAFPAATAAFDGHYGGPLVAASGGRTGECARRAVTADLVVRNGRALVSIGDYGPALHGPVAADGSARFRGAVDALAVVSGRFEDGRFVGELRGWGCAYALNLKAPG
jgi:hypothetical protein